VHYIHIIPHKSEKSSLKEQKQGKTNTAEKILPDSCISDLDLLKIVEIWPKLPGHIKAAIKTLIQTYEGGA